MTDSNSNLTTEELELEQQFKEILSKTKYVLTNAQYEEFNRLAALYESLHVLLQPFDTDDNVGHIIGLLDHINSSFFQELENLSPVSI